MYFFRLCTNFSYQAFVTASGLSPCLSPTPPQKSLRCQALFPCVLVNCIALARGIDFPLFLDATRCISISCKHLQDWLLFCPSSHQSGRAGHLERRASAFIRHSSTLVLKRIMLSRCLNITKLVLKNPLLSSQGLMVRSLKRNKLHLLFKSTLGLTYLLFYRHYCISLMNVGFRISQENLYWPLLVRKITDKENTLDKIGL